MKTLIYDNDAANDDIIALIYLLIHPECNLAAITIAGTGEAHGPIGAKNLADLCFMLGNPDIPIAYGKAEPRDSSGKPFPDFLRKLMDEVFEKKGVPTNPSPNITNSAVDLMVKTIQSSDELVTILATGPLTNVAELIETHPELVSKIEKIVIMGGAVHVKGNIKGLEPKSDNDVAEWNIYADPKAADTVFTSKIPVTLVSLDATNQIPMTKEFYDSLSVQQQPELKLIYELMKMIVDELGMETFLKEFYLWDPLAAMICLDPRIAITETTAILVDLKTAQTEPVDVNTKGSSLINVAIKIPEAKLILDRLITEIKQHLINKKCNVTPISFLQPPQQIKVNEKKETIDLKFHY